MSRLLKVPKMTKPPVAVGVIGRGFAVKRRGGHVACDSIRYFCSGPFPTHVRVGKLEEIERLLLS
jgi:hypothetical protein